MGLLSFVRPRFRSSVDTMRWVAFGRNSSNSCKPIFFLNFAGVSSSSSFFFFFFFFLSFFLFFFVCVLLSEDVRVVWGLFSHYFYQLLYFFDLVLSRFLLEFSTDHRAF